MKNLILFFFSIFSILNTYAQVGINADNSAPHSSAMLDVKSTSKAFYPPRMNTTDKNNIVNKQAGAVVFDITLNQLNYYNGTSWVAASGGELTLPYIQSKSAFVGYSGGLLKITNSEPTFEAVAINGIVSGINGYGIRAMATNTDGVNTGGIYATNNSTNNNGVGIWGTHAGGGVGVKGGSISGVGVSGNSNSGDGVSGISNSGAGVYGSSSFLGVYGFSEAPFGYGIYGISNGSDGVGVRGNGNGNAGDGVQGHAYTGSGVYGFSTGGKGINGASTSGTGGFFSSTNGNALITLNGNVGIGVIDPSYILETKSRVRIRHSVDGTPDDNTAGILYNNSSNGVGAFSGMKTDNQVGLFIGGNWRFWVDNTGAGYLNGNLIQTSDKRLKKDFTQLNNSLSNIYKINGYHFRWIEEARNKEIQTGFIAQEVQKIFPELVQTDDKGFLSVNYIGLIPHLIEAVKVLKNENELLKIEQKATVDRLEKIEELLNTFAKK
ncbi:MAG: tail fiber domain-containing protein [Bacteroidota bacterium]